MRTISRTNFCIIIAILCGWHVSNAYDARENERSSLMHKQDIAVDVGYATISCQKYYVEATKHKTPMLFIHGGPGFESGLITNLKALAFSRPCIFYDQAGCGKSLVKEGVSVDWSLEHYVHELEMLIDALQIKTCIFYGFSWGGALATCYTLEHPNRVEKLILASPYLSTASLVDGYKTLAMSMKLYDTIMSHDKAGTTDSAEFQAAWKSFLSSFICRKDLSIFNELTFNKEISDAMWGPYELISTGNLKDMDLTPHVNDLQLPVLLTSGFHDPMRPEYMKWLNDQIHESRWVLFKHSAHMPHLEEDDAYIKLLEEFVAP